MTPADLDLAIAAAVAEGEAASARLLAAPTLRDLTTLGAVSLRLAVLTARKRGTETK